MRILKYIFLSIILGLILLVSIPSTIYLTISRSFRDEIYFDVSNVNSEYAALVLGAGLDVFGEPSSILKDRVKTATELYFQGRVKKIIMSGDNRYLNYNEPDAMREYAVELGVSNSDIISDYAGRRTYDSCYRVKNIFNQTNIIVVTQSFHITRAMFICNSLGIETTGVISDVEGKYNNLNWNYWKVRDIFALTQSILDLYVYPPEVVGGDKIEI